MFFENPFGCWANGGQGNSANTIGQQTCPPPSVFGALPYPTDSSINTFYFTSFNPDIFNCNVIGPQAQVQYRVVTDNRMPGYTVIQNLDGKNISLIEWQSRPMIEVRNLISKQPVKTWLPLTHNKCSRTMTIRGMQYSWVPQDKSINLYVGGSANATFIARISRTNGTITLDLTNDAMQLGLLDALVSATLLLQCGRNID